MTAAVLEHEDQADVDDVSEDAPYGVNPKTGKPYKHPPEQRAEWAARMAAARWGNAVPKAPGKGSGTQRKPAKPDYRQGIVGLVQIPAFALGIVAKYTRNQALALDSATLTLHAPNLAEAVNETAQHQQWLANLLDKALAVGPYGALLAAGLPLALQLAANHGRIEPNPELGILDEAGLKAALMNQAPK